MLKPALWVFACFCFSGATAQFYFQDIVSAANTSKNFQLLKTNRIKTVAVTSIEPDGSETEDFGISQQVSSSKNQLVTNTRSGMTGASTMITTFNAQGMPVSISDSTPNTVNDVRYFYDASGKLLRVSSSSHEPEDTNHYTLSEEHLFSYDPQGHLVKMMKIKDRFDTLSVVFIPAEIGLPGEEQWWRKGQKIETWFYYYDAKNQLTDIVRYNATARKMLPDYIFEYDEGDRMSQQTVIQPGTNFYRVWIYEYNDNGLKKAETIFKKGKEQEGRILYAYE